MMTIELKRMMISRMMAAYSVSETDTDHSVKIGVLPQKSNI